MSDFALPTLSSLYADFLSQLKARDVDSLTLCLSTPSNPPVGAIKFDRVGNKFQEYDGALFQDKLLSIAGGGTGASSASSARSNLGLGTLAVQNNSAVNITGGSITGVSLDASGITTGILGLARGGTGASLGIGAAGTFLRSNGSVVSFGVDGSALTNLNASALSSGTVNINRLPAGVGYVRNILQLVTSTVKSLTGTYADTPLQLSITPSSATSRIRVEISANLHVFSNGSAGISAQLIRGITPSSVVVREWIAIIGIFASLSTFPGVDGQVYLDYIDSPATTAATIYTLQLKAIGSVATAKLNDTGNYTSTITLSEIGA